MSIGIDDIPLKALVPLLYCHRPETIINGCNCYFRTTSTIQETSRTTNPEASIIFQLSML